MRGWLGGGGGCKLILVRLNLAAPTGSGLMARVLIDIPQVLF